MIGTTWDYQNASNHGRRTFLYSAMRELTCNGNFGQERLSGSFAELQGRIARTFSSNSLVNTKDMTAAIQYILTAAELLGSEVYYKKSRMTILGLAGALFCENEQA